MLRKINTKTSLVHFGDIINATKLVGSRVGSLRKENQENKRYNKNLGGTRNGIKYAELLKPGFVLVKIRMEFHM